MSEKDLIIRLVFFWKDNWNYIWLRKFYLFCVVDVENALEEAKRQHYQEIKQQENALNKVKRDLTKAVVALRQAERWFLV